MLPINMQLIINSVVVKLMSKSYLIQYSYETSSLCSILHPEIRQNGDFLDRIVPGGKGCVIM